MRIEKRALAACAVASLLAAAGAAKASTAGTYTDTVLGSIKGLSGALTGTINGTGTAVLDSDGTLTATNTVADDTNLGGDAQVVETDVFSGTYSDGVFTATSGTEDVTSCVQVSGVSCASTPENTPTPFLTASGVITVAGGGSISVTSTGGGGLAHITTTETITPVPLPPATWLLGSGLLGLVGAARCRRPSHPAGHFSFAG